MAPGGYLTVAGLAAIAGTTHTTSAFIQPLSYILPNTATKGHAALSSVSAKLPPRIGRGHKTSTCMMVRGGSRVNTKLISYMHIPTPYSFDHRRFLRRRIPCFTKCPTFADRHVSWRPSKYTVRDGAATAYGRLPNDGTDSTVLHPVNAR